MIVEMLLQPPIALKAIAVFRVDGDIVELQRIGTDLFLGSGRSQTAQAWEDAWKGKTVDYLGIYSPVN